MDKGRKQDDYGGSYWNLGSQRTNHRTEVGRTNHTTTKQICSADNFKRREEIMIYLFLDSNVPLPTLRNASLISYHFCNCLY